MALDFAPAPTGAPTLHAPLHAPEPASESAYFVDSDALVRLDANGWTTIELPDEITPFEVLLGSDGRAYARDWHHLGRLDGDRFELLASIDEGRLIHDVAIGGSGELAIVTSQAKERTLHILRNGRWSAAPTYHEHWPSLRTAAFDRFGNLWTWQRAVVRSG